MLESQTIKYKHLTDEERLEIQECLDHGVTFKDIRNFHTAAHGESLNSFINRAIGEAVERDNAKGAQQ